MTYFRERNEASSYISYNGGGGQKLIVWNILTKDHIKDVHNFK